LQQYNHSKQGILLIENRSTVQFSLSDNLIKQLMQNIISFF